MIIYPTSQTLEKWAFLIFRNCVSLHIIQFYPFSCELFGNSSTFPPFNFGSSAAVKEDLFVGTCIGAVSTIPSTALHKNIIPTLPDAAPLYLPKRHSSCHFLQHILTHRKSRFFIHIFLNAQSWSFSIIYKGFIMKFDH